MINFPLAYNEIDAPLANKKEYEMKYKIEYWTAGDSIATRTVEAASEQAAIDMLVDDPQEPLAQVKSVTVL